MKHAFLIIAHNEFLVLQRLISSLDHEQIDFFVHIDKKVKTFPELKASKAGLFIVKKRIDTRWGDVSQIKTEFALFKEAFWPKKYEFYHLISGVHFPIIRTEDILSFYNQVAGNTVFNVSGKDTSNQMAMKLQRYNLFTKRYAYGPLWVQKISQKLWRFTIMVQDIIGIKRHQSEEFYKAPNWISFSEESIQYLIDREQYIYKKYKWTFCGDEYFAPTELMSSPFSERTINSDRILFQEFGPASPRILEERDYKAIVDSGCLFARKFSAKHTGIIDMIEESRH